MLSRDEVGGCRSGILHRSRYSQYWRRLKVVPGYGVLNSSNSYSTGNPFLMVMPLLLLKRADNHYVCPERRSFEEEKVFGGFPQFGAAREDGPG